MTDVRPRCAPLRRVAPLLAAVLVLAACSSDDQRLVPAEPHTIVLVDLSAVRADRLSAWGHDRATSPALDALAESAVRFEWAFGQSPITGPAQASILTGQYPSVHGMAQATDRLDPEVVTLAERLSEAGFATAGFTDGGYLDRGFGLDQGFDTWESSNGKGLSASVEAALAFLDQRSSDQPLFLLVHGQDAWLPWDPPAAARSALLGDAAAPEGLDASPAALQAARETAATDGDSGLTPEQLDYLGRLYDAELRAVDDAIARLVAGLEERGLLDRATLVVLGDHGSELGEHGTVLNDRLHTTVTRVPFLVRFPGGQPSGTISEPVEAVDLAPTVLDLVGLFPGPEIQGETLVPLVEGRARPRFFAFTESDSAGDAAVALAGYRLVRSDGGAASLFDLAADPLELSPIEPPDERKIAVLLRHLDEWRSANELAAAGGSDADPVDEETLRQLKDLGYIQ